MSVLSMVKDGFANFITGIGLANPKQAGNVYTLGYVDQTQAEAAYDTSTWFGKIIDIPANDATREWREWQAEKNQVELIEGVEKLLQVRQKVRQALIWSRLYGGAVLIPGGLPGRTDEPLSVDRIKQNSVRFLSVLHRWQITAHGEIRDPLSPDFGKPEYYSITNPNNVAGELKLHPSRVILINGRRTGSKTGTADGIWGMSIWTHLADSIMSSDAGASIIAALMHEAKIDVVKIPNMMQSMATKEYESIMLRRFQLAATLKSVSNVLMLDGDDDWSQKTMNWNGLPQVMDTLLTVMSGAADIPKTRLLGEQQSGLSGTDAGSVRNYYDSVKAKQELEIQPQMTPLDEIIIRSALGNFDESIWYKWRPLWQMTEKEAAEVDKLEAEAVTLYANTGLIPQQALAVMLQNRMIDSSLWPGADTAWNAATEELDEPEDTGTEEEIAADLGDARPMTLYVRRNVTNAAEIIAWAKAQGFKTTLPAEDLHVTITFSRTPVDWIKMGSPYNSTLEIPEGGPRVMERFGDARVLLFTSQDVEWRHQLMVELGASHDHAEYQPHITISYSPDSPDISSIEPYRGKILLGPEIFEEINDNWLNGVKEE